MKTVTALRAPANGKGRYTVYFDDGSKLRLLPEVIVDFDLREGSELEEADLAELLELAGQASAKNRAVRIISVAGVSKGDLERRLIQKGETETHAREAVEWLSQLDLLDDRETARQIVARGVSRGYGKHRIQQMLYEKQIPREYWEGALSALPPMDDAIDVFLRQRLGNGVPQDRKEIQRAVDALLRRGHRWPEIQAGLRRLGTDPEDMED